MSTHPRANFFTITEVTHELGLTLRALRFYESKGLIAPKRKLRARLYSNNDIERVRLILELKSFGLSIREIKGVLKHPGNGPYGLTEALYVELVARVESQKSAAEAALGRLQGIASSFLSAGHKRSRPPHLEEAVSPEPSHI